MEIKGIVYSMEITEFAIMASIAGIPGLYMPAVTIPDIGKEEVILQIHKMFRKHLLTRESEGDRVVPAEPYASFFEIIRPADTCLALRTAGDRIPGCCLYGSDRIVCIKTHYIGREKLTLQMLTAEELADYLIESGFCPEDITDKIGESVRDADMMQYAAGEMREFVNMKGNGESALPTCSDRLKILQIGTEEFVKKDGIQMTADRVNRRTKEITGRFYLGTGATGFYLESVGAKTDVHCPYSHAALVQIVREFI